MTIGWSDPPPLVPTQLRGVWSSYWYNGLIYEGHINEGLNLFQFTGPETRRDVHLLRLRVQVPQIAMTTTDA